ncbi:hypothetical protein PENARI_c008G00898 [Penicillium arizonense]|uniref:USP domain-containing protein n=1 Tax=Penicillium arizonense TaxID=1835702 RepID=A0A1F5LK00_PENAI|nr:hypothetical protein PENARI_c008G00898 [Penicillium arizonense]OGE53350.1 hypothetical protein PENARI_c008G00898 [Penicillium arizonense]
MAVSPPDSYHPPPDTPLNEDNVRDSMEDLDPQATRKRPRLDSGSRVSPSLSLDGMSRPVSAPASEMDDDPARPASKFTINMKSPPSPAALDLPSAESQLPDNAPELQVDSDAASANVISIHSSSSQGSPHIEVADPEDMNQESNHSNWKPLAEVLNEQGDMEVVEDEDIVPLTDSFPKLHEDMRPRDNFKAIADMIEHGHPREGIALAATKQWLNTCVNNLDRVTLEAFMEEPEFWGNFPFIMERLVYRQRPLQLDDDEDTLVFLEELLLDYARLVFHFVRIDTVSLSRVQDDADMEGVTMTSRRYLACFPYMLQSSNVPLYRAMDAQCRIAMNKFLASVKDDIALPPFNASRQLLDYATLVTSLVPTHSKLLQHLPQLTMCACALLGVNLDQNSSRIPDSSVDSAPASPSLQEFFDMTRAVATQHEKYVTKKSPLATSDVSEHLVRSVFRAYNFLCSADDKFVVQLANYLGIELPEDLPEAQRVMAVTWAWKFDAMKKHLMEGRMELRVHGVDAMQTDLVNIWTHNSPPNTPEPAMVLMRYLVKLLREHKILDYLVGIDSHPQLLTRTSNIFGFLIMTHTYTDRDTDMIWKTITESQDDRTVSEVIKMLARTFPIHASRSAPLLYVCSKLLELPLERFDNRIIELCDQLVPRMRERTLKREPELAHVDAIPLKLCVRLIRESSGATYLPPDQRELMQTFGSEQLGLFMKAGLNESDKVETYERCIQDIAEMNSSSAGSIQVLNALVPFDDAPEVWKLANDFDLTRLVIMELHNFVNKDQREREDLSFGHGFPSRVEILRRLIEMAPETITPDLGNTLWNEVLMSKNLTPEERQVIWKMMVDVANRSVQENPFLERCIHEYLPSLLPVDYSHAVLCFAQQSLHYQIQVTLPPTAGEDEVISIPGMDRIWNFILTAPPNTIEGEAIKFAINVYLDHPIVRRAPRSAIDATHIALVGRCVDQLKSAAAALRPSSNGTPNGDASMEIDGLNQDLGGEKLMFSRSLLFLRQLLHGLRARPQYNSPRGTPPRIPERSLKGDPVNIQYQCFGGNSSSKIATMQIGALSTAAELVERLVQLSRFSKLTTIIGGQKVDLLQDPNALVQNLKLPSGLLIVRKAPNAQELPWAGRTQSLTSVDSEVLKHFDEFYDLLELKDDLARQIIDFLLVFPPQEQAVNLVRSVDNSEKDMFPLQKPFKALYSLNTLSICLHEEALETSPRCDFISHSIKVLVAFLTGDELLESMDGNPIGLLLATRAVECLLFAFSVYRSADANAALVPEPNYLVQRLCKMIDIGLQDSPDSLKANCLQKLICSCFAVLLDGSVRDQNIWDAVKEQANFDELILSLLLIDSRKTIRVEALERIKIICGPLKPSKLPTNTSAEETGNSTEDPLRIDILATLWNSLVQVIPTTPLYATQSEEFFNAALWMFRTIAEKSPCDLIFNDYLKQWSSFMLTHQTEEFIGREPVDNLIVGFSSLLEWCLKLANAANIHLDTLDIAEQILQKYLFPDLSPESTTQQDARTPVMNTNTRRTLYSVVSLLCKQSDETYFRVLEILNTTVPRDVTYFDWSFDRSAMIRSQEGYAGLRNLSNTCYLNSLMTQLFMNVEFRDFILKLHIADPDSQKLLFETQKLFTWMQETWRKSIEPQDFVDSIRTFDNEPIDVTIQMDVDEFYNLLFDRWESQVLDAESKKKFRSFYGGQLVQQIKSMECPHISERLEPFSAIQCEIKGKASLEDSLRAYVAGEVMQGDNKYFCTSCDNHVNAVKRACLKDVPDNLIFHLKRFDFDMVTMLRSKINDEFVFPRHIDMTPYTVEHLADPEQPAKPDYFELTGVLVHTGTAESGHYYTYTLERPSPDGEPSWVEFNDSDVSRFDPSSIADHCFGGPSEQMQYNGEPKNKAWNAYMLFYQRVSTMEESKSVYKPAKPNIPVHVPVSVAISNHIAMDNELLIRTYCLLDPQYAFFVEGLLQRWSGMTDDNPDKSFAETLAINVGMDTFEQMVSRTKDLQGHQELFTVLISMINKSPNAARSSLDWIFDRKSPIRNLMTKMHQPEVRHKEILLIIFAVKHLHMLSKDPNLEESEQAFWRNSFEEVIIRLVPMLIEVWPSVQSISRVWEDYFGFFVKLCNYGPWVVELLADKQMFTVCLQILWLDEDDKKRMRVHLPNYWRLLEKGRRFTYLSMLSLFHTFLKHIDLSLEPVGLHDPRSVSNGKFSLRLHEVELIKPIERDGSLAILRHILKQDGLARSQTAHLIIATFLGGEPAAGFLPSIQKTIENGLRIEPAVQCTPFLDAAVIFCQHCPIKQRVIDMITFVANGVDSIDSSGGQEHIAFFISLCQTSNERLNLNANALAEIVFTMIPTWAPTLLIDRNENVRQSMQNILGVWVFTDRNEEASSEGNEEDDETDHDPIQKRRPVIGRGLVRASIDRLKTAFVKDPPRRVDRSQIANIAAVMQYCLDNYFSDSEEDQQTVTEAKNLLLLLETLSLEEFPEDQASESEAPSPEEWEANSAMASDSEVGVAGSP